MALITNDEHPAYETAIVHDYGDEVATAPSGRGSSRMVPEKVPPPRLVDAAVEVRGEKGQVVEIVTRVVFGTIVAYQAVSAKWKTSRWINTSFPGRQDATDRHYDWKAGEADTPREGWRVREAMTRFIRYRYVFGRAVRTLAERDEVGRVRRRTPSMAAGLADHVWTMREGVTMPAVQRRRDTISCRVIRVPLS